MENWDACRYSLGHPKYGQNEWARNFMGALQRHMAQASVQDGREGAPDAKSIAASQMSTLLAADSAHSSQEEKDRHAVEYDGMALAEIPQERHTDNLRRAALRSDGRAIRFIPHEHRTSDLCCVAVRNTSLALDDLTPEERTDTVWFTALSSDNRAISEITPELAATLPTTRYFIQNNWDRGRCLSSVVSILAEDPHDWMQRFEEALPADGQGQAQDDGQPEQHVRERRG